MSGQESAGPASVVEAERLARDGLAAVLGRPKVVLDIGFGRAELLMDLAHERPERCFLGVEVSRKRVAKAARRVHRRGLTNCFLLHATAEYAVERVLPERSVSECWICCPDPWPKKRHHKRRLIQAPFVDHLVRLLEPDAPLHIATDDPAYADWIAEVMRTDRGLTNLHAPRPYSRVRPERRATAYEQEWLDEGRRMAYFDYRRRA
ncbi:MAG: tRNA (guanosine(46)-N7)-methyltransferase TrmB [Proteobacteria bacterium]|nr:tRNA (guanosine(46)-N7)-methyltransferase TrmB [Pseudomonadota bacterium]